MGCGPYSYWLGNLLADYLMFICTVAVNFMIPYLFEVGFFFNDLNYAFTFLFLTLGFGFGMITFAYVYGFLFAEANTAYKIFPFVFVPLTLLLPYYFVEMVASLDEYNIYTERC